MKLPERLMWMAIFALICLVLNWIGTAALDVSKPMTTTDAAGQMELNLSAFIHRIHRYGVVASAWTTLTIYQFAFVCGWYQRIAWVRLRHFLYVPFLAATLLASVFCWATIGKLNLHWLAQTTFFLIFVAWDILMKFSAKNPDDKTARHCERCVKGWLLHVDIFTPALLWTAYLVVFRFVPQEAMVGQLSLRELMLTGVLISILFTLAWGWLVDLLFWRE